MRGIAQFCFPQLPLFFPQAATICKPSRDGLLEATRGLPGRVSGGEHQFIAGLTERFVPGAGEAGEQLFDRVAGDGQAGMHDFAPGTDEGAFGARLETDPLGDGHADGVINPADALAGNASGDDVIDDRVDGTEKLDLKTAAGLPGAAVGPAEFAVDIGEGMPTMAIGKNEPGESRAGFGDNRVFKLRHSGSSESSLH